MTYVNHKLDLFVSRLENGLAMQHPVDQTLFLQIYDFIV